MNLPKQVTIIEVGPRDGLQNEPSFVSTADKVNLINALSQSGLKHIEVTSFVSPKAIPQMADHDIVFREIEKHDEVHYSALVPNQQGMEMALAAGVKEVAIFTAASETFNQRNIHCSIKESIERFKPVFDLANQHHITVRSYISCVLGCPYEGEIKPEKVVEVIHALKALGAKEISFGDTIGVGTPRQTNTLLEHITKSMPLDDIAMHFHDTYGQAIANIFSALAWGVNRFDSSLAGLGGCPYARGATGNVATEDVLYLLHGLGIETGVDIYKLVTIGDEICTLLKRRNQSKVANALLAKSCQ